MIEYIVMKSFYFKPEIFVLNVRPGCSFLQITSPCYGVEEGTAEGQDIPVVNG